MDEASVAADDLDEILEAAADALIEAVGVDRAAVLLHDDEHVMRFRAGAFAGQTAWPTDDFLANCSSVVAIVGNDAWLVRYANT